MMLSEGKGDASMVEGEEEGKTREGRIKWLCLHLGICTDKPSACWQEPSSKSRSGYARTWEQESMSGPSPGTLHNLRPISVCRPCQTEFSKAEGTPLHPSVPRAQHREGTIAKQSCVELTWKEKQELGFYGARWL